MPAPSASPSPSLMTTLASISPLTPGGTFLRDKMVDATNKLVVVVDDTKLVSGFVGNGLITMSMEVV